MAGNHNKTALRGNSMTAKIRKLLDQLANLLRQQEPGAADRALESIKSEESQKDGKEWTN